MVRTVITIAALMTALSMLISISIMILSFRKTVDLWVEQSLNGDAFIFPGSYSITGYSALLPLEVSRDLPSLPGVKAVDSFRALEIEYQDQPALIAAVDGQVFLNMKVIRFTARRSPGHSPSVRRWSVYSHDREFFSPASG